MQIDVANETKGYGADIADEMVKKILDAQSSEVDGHSGATITSDAIKKAAESCINQARGVAVAPTEAGKKMWVHMTNSLCDWRSNTDILNAYVENSEEAMMWYLNRAGLTDETEYGDGSKVDSNANPSDLLHNDEKGIFAYMCTSQDLTGVWKDRTDTYDFGSEHCYFFAPWIGPKPQNVGNVLAAVLENVQAKNSNLETFGMLAAKHAMGQL